MKTTTTDLSDFGYREKDMAADLLKAMSNGQLPADFEDSEVTVMMNTYSGNVFLTNSEYQVCMLTNEGELESFYSSPYEGHEGFFDELLEEYENMHPEDQEWFRNVAECINREDELPELD